MQNGMHSPKKGCASIPRQARLIVRHCPQCGLFVAASPNQKLLDTMLRIHECPESLPFGALARK